MRRRDFFLDEPLNCQEALDDLREFTKTNLQYFNLPSDLNVAWIKTLGHNLEDVALPHTIDRVRTAIENPTQVMVLWSAGSNVLLSETMVSQLNSLCDSIPNPIVLVVGMLGDWIKQWEGKLKFTLSPAMFFEYESASAWENNLSFPIVERNKKFLSMGTKDYPNRKFLLSNILTSGLHNDGYVSYISFNGSYLPNAHYATDEIQHINGIADLANKYLPIKPIDDNPYEWTRMPRQFMADSYLNMVTDTFFETHKGATFISEKVYNAMMHEQMFMMMSPTNTLKFLRDNRFRTFGEYIDESYDSIENNHDRLIAVTEVFIDFVRKPIEEIREIYVSCLPILEHNRKLVGSKRLTQFLLTEIQRAVNEKAQTK